MTLPSNSSKLYFPNNTLTKFSTQLQSSIDLSNRESWEVALVDIMFPKTWYTIPDRGTTFTVTCNSCQVSAPEQYQKNYPPSTRSVEIKISSGYYGTIDQLVNKMNKAVNNSIASLTSIMKHATSGIEFDNNWVHFKVHDVSKRVVIQLQPNVSITFSDLLISLLGIGSNQNPIVNSGIDVESTRAQRVYDLNAGIHSLYVYCDILEEVTIGDSKAPLLRIVDTAGNQGEMIYKTFHDPRYVPLQRKSFDSIEIDIRDGYGEPMAFESGQLIVTLHFRLAKNPYFL
jgi:hypothetical protein